MLRQFERIIKRLFLSILKVFIGSRPPSDLATRSFKRILVIRQHDQLGDMLCVVPLLRSLRQRYPDAHITLMASPVNHDVMLNNPLINRLIQYDKREFVGAGRIKLGKFLSFIHNLRKERYELSIVPSTVSTSATSDLLAYLSGAAYRVGASEMNRVENPSHIFHNCPVKLTWDPAGHRHQTLRNLDIAHSLWLNASDLSSMITVTKEELDAAKLFLGSVQLSSHSFVVYHPGAGKPPNRWPAERFSEAAGIIAKDMGMMTVVTRGPMDDEPVNTMIHQLAVPYQLIDKKGIREVAAILSFARLVVSNDTGIMHVAAAVGTPVLSLFGPTDPEQWAPIGTRHRYIVGKGGDIGAIEVEEVVNAAVEMLQQQ